MTTTRATILIVAAHIEPSRGGKGAFRQAHPRTDVRYSIGYQSATESTPDAQPNCVHRPIKPLRRPVLTKTNLRGRPPRRVGHNLLLRLSTRRPDVLRFLTDPRVPFTNNLAERDARMMKLRQKISGGFRSGDGANDFAVIRSVLYTARKQGWDLLATLTNDTDQLVTETPRGLIRLRYLGSYR
jgi:hypothetical protein